MWGTDRSEPLECRPSVSFTRSLSSSLLVRLCHDDIEVAGAATGRMAVLSWPDELDTDKRLEPWVSASEDTLGFGVVRRFDAGMMHNEAPLVYNEPCTADNL